jgi:hypothetical protein
MRTEGESLVIITAGTCVFGFALPRGRLEAWPLRPDLQHDLAARVPARHPRQRLARPIQETPPRPGAQPAGIDQTAQRLQPLPGDVRGGRFPGDPALQLDGRTWHDHEYRAAAVTYRADGLVAGPAAGAAEQQIGAAQRLTAPPARRRDARWALRVLLPGRPANRCRGFLPGHAQRDCDPVPARSASPRRWLRAARFLG